MSDLTRRDFIKVGATGIALASAGGMLLPKHAFSQETILSQCPPGAPYREEDYYLICPSDDPEPQRTYSALIQVVGEQEYVRMYGVDYYPFDGSYYESDSTLETGNPSNYFLCRAICNNVVYDTPEYGAPVAASRTEAPLRKTQPPKPMLPRVTKKTPGDFVEITVDSWESVPEGARLHNARLWLIRANGNNSVKRPRNPAQNRRQNSFNRQIVAQGDFKDVFGRKVPLNLHHGIYYLVTEIVYDYGTNPNPDLNKFRFRGNSSWLKVNMSVPTHEQWEERPPRV